MGYIMLNVEIGPDIAAQRGYPVRVDFPESNRRSRFYAFPVIGFIVKMIMLIPFFIANFFVTLIIGILMLFTWIPAFFFGRYPRVALRWYGGHIRWMVRVYSFMYGITDKYPSLNFDDNTGDGYVTVTYGAKRLSNRLYSCPIVGMLLKTVMLLPHVLITFVLLLLTSLSMLIVWFPVLIGGRYPRWALGLIAGTVRYIARAQAFWYGLTDSYPPLAPG